MAKIINPSKLLPSAKSTAIARVAKPKSVNILAKTSPLSKGLLATRQSKESKESKESKNEIDTNNKLIKIDKFLKSDLIVSQKKAEVKRKGKEKQDFDEAEKKLETPKLKGFKLPSLGLPSLGFFDRVKRFLFFTALGWLLPKIIEFLPKLEGFAKIVGGIYNFAEGLFGKLFDGFMSLVKFGGDLKDKTIGFIASAKAGVGGNYQKEFDKLEKQFNTFVNASIIAGVLAADIGSAAVDEFNKQRKGQKPKPGIGGAPSASYKYDSKRALVRKKYGDAAARIYDNQIANGKTPLQALKNVESRYIRKGRITAERMTGSLAGTDKGSKVFGRGIGRAAKRGAIKTFGRWDKIFKGPFAKLKGPLSRFGGSVVPGLGAVVGAADAKARFSAGDKIGGALASVSAALDAATAASALTGIGLPVAGVLGLISMSIDVILLIRDILSIIPGIPKNLLGFSRGGRVVKKYQGGGNTRGGRPVGAPKRRSITPTRRKPPRVILPKTQPGKDVGGEKKVKEFYAKPEDPSKKYVRPAGGWLSSLFGEKKQDLSAFDTLKKMSGTLKSDETLAKGILGVMSSGIDMALGQKPDKKVFKAFFDSIGYIADTLASQRAGKSMSSLRSQIGAFAEGGTVPSRGFRGTYGDANTGDMLAKLIGPTIDQRVNEAIQSIEKQLQMKGAVGPGGGAGPDAGGAGGGAGGGDFSGNTRAMKAFNFFKSQGYTDYQAAGIVGNLLQENRAMDPTLANSIGMKGIAQWDANRWSNLEKFAASKNLDPNSFETQLQFIQKELKTGEGGLSEKTLKSTKTLEDAAVIFRKQYERPGEAEAMDENRIKYARDVLSSSKTPTITGSANSLAEAAKNLKGMSSAAGPEGGNKACVWAVNQVFKKAGIQTPWGNSNYVPDAENAMIRSGYIQVQPGQQRPGDVYIVSGQEHIGIVLPNGNIISNSSSGAKFSWEASTSSYESFYGGPGKFYRIPAPPGRKNPADTANQPPTRLSLEQARDFQNRSSNLKPGDKPIVIPGIGSIQMGTDFFGNPKKKYFSKGGKEINQQQFNELMIKYKLPIGSSIDAKAIGTPIAQRAQGGGLISPSKPNRIIPNSFASYETPGGGMMIAIQPMIIEKQVPVSGGRDKMIAFPVPVAVNSNIDLSLSRG